MAASLWDGDNSCGRFTSVFSLQSVGPEDLLRGHQQLRRLDRIRLLRSGLVLVLDFELSFCVIIYYHNLFVS